MECKYFVTDYGLSVGWVAMHIGGFCQNVESRYLPWGEYTPATIEELDAAVDRGELRKELGHYKNIGGILHDWVAATA